MWYPLEELQFKILSHWLDHLVVVAPLYETRGLIYALCLLISYMQSPLYSPVATLQGSFHFYIQGVYKQNSKISDELKQYK